VRPTDTTCAGASATASNYDQTSKPNVTCHETARWASFPKSEIVDALTAIRRIAIDADEAKEGRLSDGYLSAADIVVILRAYREFAALPFSVRSQPEASLNAFRLRAIRAALGPMPEHPFNEKTIAEAKTTIDKEDRRAKILESSGILNAHDLGGMAFAPVRWAIPDLVPEGLTLLSGSPKSGKSWLSLDLLRAITTGGFALGRVEVEKGRGLYMSLEDSPRRLQARLAKLGGDFPPWLDLVTDLPRGYSLVDFLDAYTSAHEDCRMIVIDTLGRALQGDLNQYDEMTSLLDPLQRMALERHIALVFVHHTRKGGAEGDPFDASLGSTGIFGAMDTTLVLERKRGEDKALLRATGREIIDAELVLELLPDTMQWRITDEDPREASQSGERIEVLNAVPYEPESRRSKDIAALTGRKGPAVSRLLEKLEADGLVFSPHYGSWSRRAGKSGQTGKSTDSENEDDSHQGAWEELGGGKSRQSGKSDPEASRPPPSSVPDQSQDLEEDLPLLQDLPPFPEAEATKAKPAKRKPPESKYLVAIQGRVGDEVDALPDNLARHAFINELLKFIKRRKASEDAPWSIPHDGTASDVPSAFGEALYGTKMFIDDRLIVTGEGSPQQSDLMEGLVVYLKSEAIALGREAAR